MTNAAWYGSIVGSLLYLTVKTRLDLSVTVTVFGSHIEDADEKDVMAAERAIRYLK